MRCKKSVNITATYESEFKVLNNWLKLKHTRKTLQDFFCDNYIKTVAIYGMGELGKRLYEELSLLEIKVLYAIDKNAERIDVDGLKVLTLDEKLEKVDAIIVTPVSYFDEIEEMLNKKGIDTVVSLEDVVVYCL